MLKTGCFSDNVGFKYWFVATHTGGELFKGAKYYDALK